MEIEESCSCGASFRAIGDNVTRLVREWRKNHICEPKPVDEQIQLATSNDAKIENAIGFRVTGLTLETPEQIGWGDE